MVRGPFAQSEGMGGRRGPARGRMEGGRERQLVKFPNRHARIPQRSWNNWRTADILQEPMSSALEVAHLTAVRPTTAGFLLLWRGNPPTEALGSAHSHRAQHSLPRPSLWRKSGDGSAERRASRPQLVMPSKSAKVDRRFSEE